MKRATRTGSFALQDRIRASIAAKQAARLHDAAATLFDAGGHAVLSNTTKSAVRDAASAVARRGLGEAALPPPTARPLPIVTAGCGAAPRVAARAVAAGIGRAAGLGALVDGGVETIRGVRRLRAGTTDVRTMLRGVAREAATGGAANAVGVATAAVVIVLTGPVGPIAAGAIAVTAATTTKLALDRLVA